MTVLSGWIADGAIAGSTNPNLTGQLSQYAVAYWPPGVSALQAPDAAQAATHFQVGASPEAIAGWKVGTYVDDFYYRIHIRPAPLDLGNLVDTQVVSLKVWNAFFMPQLLGSIEDVGEGMNLAGPAALPVAFGALQEQDWSVTVTRDGPARIDSTLRWIFSASVPATLRVTGNRIVAWTFMPNWRDGVTERMAWLTEVLGSSSGAEQRRALRIAPRRSFEASVVLEGRERALMDMSLAAWGGRLWALPVWPDVQLLTGAVALGASSIACATDNRDFRAGGLALLLGATAFDYEAVEVLSITSGLLQLKRPTQAAWPAGTKLFPVRTAQLAQQPNIRRLNNRLVQVVVQFNVAEACDWPVATGLTMYRGAPVVSNKPHESGDLNNTAARLMLVLDNLAGIPRATDTADAAFQVQAHSWTLGGLSEQSAWRSLMYTLRGRQGVVWLPTHSEDLDLSALADAATSTIDVGAIGFTRFGLGRVGRRDIRIELSDGTALHRRITASAELSSSVERLTLDAPHGVILRPAGTSTNTTVTRISFMQLARLEQDEIELHHFTADDGVSRVQVLWRTRRDELELA